MVSELVARLQRRLVQYVAQDNDQALFEEPGQSDARELSELCEKTGWTEQALLILGNYHFARNVVTPNGEDLDRALDLFEELWERNPGSTPVWIRQTLVENDRHLANSDTPLAHRRARQAQAAAMMGDSPHLMEQALRELLSEYAEAKGELVKRGRIASQLGAALLADYDRTANQQRLHEAITYLQEARTSGSEEGDREARLNPGVAVAV